MSVSNLPETGKEPVSDHSLDAQHQMDEWTQRMTQRIREQSSRVSRLQQQFLKSRQESLQLASEYVRLELAGLQPAGAAAGSELIERNLGQPHLRRVTAYRQNKALYTADQLREFAEGDYLKCLSPAYQIYRGRRTPRIPNGDLLMMSRVVALQGQPGRLQEPAAIETEYDVPLDPWFHRPEATPATPYAILLEMALQPCGFLAAYLETPLAYPQENFFFRNLDGDARLIKPIDLRGKTVVNRSRLLKTSISAGIIVQKFNIEMLCENELFYSGQSVFGYFPDYSMENQVGLDGGSRVDPWLETNPITGFAVQKIAQPFSAENAHHRLDDLDEVTIIPGGGIHQQGYVYARKAIDPKSWFFNCHFLEDPVMPGSLGIESILAALRVYAYNAFGLQPGAAHGLDMSHDLSWKYRGQILPRNKTMELEIHIAGTDVQSGRAAIWGEASLWVDRVRIYQVNRAAVCVFL